MVGTPHKQTHTHGQAHTVCSVPMDRALSLILCPFIYFLSSWNTRKYDDDADNVVRGQYIILLLSSLRYCIECYFSSRMLVEKVRGQRHLMELNWRWKRDFVFVTAASLLLSSQIFYLCFISMQQGENVITARH